ncbi:MAG TPA: AI-2E family transporter [Thermoguttaceae bacterium]
MNSTQFKEQIWLAVGSLGVLAVIALAAGLVYTKAVMIPFVLAVFLTTVVSPVVDFQVLRCKIPSSLAIVLALVLVVVFLFTLGMLLIVAVHAIVTTAGDYSDSFINLTNQTFDWLKKWKVEVDHTRIADELQQRLPGLITQAAGTGTTLIANGFLITFFVIFLLAGRNVYRVRNDFYQKIESAVRRYIVTKFAISAVTGLIVWLILGMLGLRMAFVFGLLAFLLNFIPSIGSVIATLLPLPMAVAQFDSLWPIIGAVAIPGVVQMVIGNVIEPKLLGQGLELHPVTVLFALAFWGLLWGYMGMVLAVPITAVLRIVLMRFETTQAIGNLLGGQLPGNNGLMRSPV